MQKYELTETEAGTRILVRGGTRAGLVIAAVQGITAAMKPPEPSEQAETEVVDVPFAHAGESFEALFASIVADALKNALEQSHAYEHARFDLITDREAKGGFVGRPAGSFGAPGAGVRVTTGSVKRGADGGWEAEFVLERT